MKYLAVIDTNVIISALLSKNTDTATVKILEYVFDGSIIPLYNEEILEEYDEVLNRDKFGFDRSNISNVLKVFRISGINVKKAEADVELIDEKDVVFYEVVLSRVDEGAYLITGNMKHFPDKRFVVTPNEMVKIIEEQ